MPYHPSMMNDIADYLKSDKDPKGLDLYESLFETGHFFPLQRKREMRSMIQLARKAMPARQTINNPSGTVMEIGADKGSGIYAWCKSLSPAKMIVNEIEGTPYSKLFETHFPDISFDWWPCASDKVDLRSIGPINVLFIDGCKNSMFADYQRFRDRMTAGGVIFVHDITDEGPGEQWGRIMSLEKDTETIIDKTEGFEAVDRQSRGLPCGSSYEGWLRHWGGRSCGVGVVHC